MTNLNRLPFRTATILVGCSMLVSITACNKRLTSEDVRERLQEAREATLEAQQKTKAAIEAREQFYDDYREAKLDEFESRIKEIDKRISDLERTAKNSGNDNASSDINSAISELQREKENINGKMDDVRMIRREDWSYSYQEVDNAIVRIEEEIARVSESLNNSANSSSAVDY